MPNYMPTDTIEKLPTLTIAAAIEYGRSRLFDCLPEKHPQTGYDVKAALTDARLLLLHILGQSLSYVMTWPDRPLSQSQQAAYYHTIQRRACGEPVAYIVGHQAFYESTFMVSPATLIPRSESELIVETVLAAKLPVQANVLDLGTGTGAIGLSIALARPHWHITCVDVVSDAVVLAKSNQQQLNINNATIIQSSWFDSLERSAVFDVIVSNPPYVEEDSVYLHNGDLLFEPRTALTSGNNGLSDIWHIIEQAQTFLIPSGMLILEHGHQQGLSIRHKMDSHGMVNCHTLCDYSGLDRVTVGYMPDYQ